MTRNVILCEQKNVNSNLRLVAVSRKEQKDIYDVRFRHVADSGLSTDEQIAEMTVEEGDGVNQVIVVGNDESVVKKLHIHSSSSFISLHKDESTPIDCDFHQVQEQNTLQRRANCSGIGTPAQGWYLSGKLIKHDSNCHTSDMRCSFPFSQSERWVVYDKPFPKDIALDKCGNDRDCKISKDFLSLNSTAKIQSPRCGKPARTQIASSP